MNHRIRTLSLITCMTGAFLLSGCSSSDDDKDPVSDNELVETQSDSTGSLGDPAGTPGGVATSVDDLTETLDEADMATLEGVYERRGYGELYVFANNRTTTYSLSENYCLELVSFEGLAGLSPKDLAQTRYELKGGQLNVALPASAFITRFDRIEELPARCEVPVPRDAQGVFEYVWNSFNEFYAFFDLQNVDWSAEYSKQTSRVGDVTDDASLFDLLADLISPLDDERVAVGNDNAVFFSASPKGSEQELRRAFEAQSEITEYDDFREMAFNRLFQLVAGRLDADSVQEQGPMIWGTADAGSTGYLFIDRMNGYAQDDEGNFLDDPSDVQELNAAIAAMDRVMAELGNTSKLIIDIRLNRGGHDAISLEFARRFVSERQLAVSKTARGRNFESLPTEAWLEPLETGGYLSPVKMIISADTSGAAEVFTMSMNQLPQVTLIGESTAGSLSDTLVKPLPNGWAVGMSNEVYLDANGISYEVVGIPPDLEVPVFQLENILLGTDPALERALSSE